MVLSLKTRLVLAGAVVGASMLTLAVANAQFDPTTGAPTTTPGVPQTTPGVSPPPGSVPPTQPSPYDTGTDAGTGGSGAMPTVPSPFGSTDAGLGGSGLMPPPPFGTDSQDAGFR